MELMIFYKILDDEAVLAMLNNNYSKALRYIIEFSESESVTDTSVKEYIINLLIKEDNILSILSEQKKNIGDDLYRAALADIEQIYNLFFTAPIKYIPSGNIASFSGEYKDSIIKMTKSETPAELLESLCEHYRNLGCGDLSRFVAFKYADKIKGVVLYL